MNKRATSKILALGSIVAVANGCSGGGSSAAPPKAAIPNSTSRVASTAHVTITPSALKHAASRRRKPQFVDGGSPPQGSTLSLQISTSSNDSGPEVTTNTNVPLSFGQTSITASFPIYGPSGNIDITEISTDGQNNITTIADTGFLSYNFTVGTDVTLNGNNVFGQFGNATGLTLNAIIGGIAFDDTPDGSDNPMILSSSSGFPTCDEVEGSGTLYMFPADPLGNFAAAAVPGGFPNSVTMTSAGSVSNGFTIVPTLVTGVFKYNTGSYGSATNVTFQAADVFGHTTTAYLTLDASGYLCGE